MMPEISDINNTCLGELMEFLHGKDINMFNPDLNW